MNTSFSLKSLKNNSKIIKQSTIDQYISKLKGLHLIRFKGKPMKDFSWLNDTEDVIPFILQRYGTSNATSMSYITAIVAILGRLENIDKKILEDYKKQMMQLFEKVKFKEGENKLSEKERENFVDCQDILKIRPQDVYDDSIFNFYTGLPPRRLRDLQYMKITYKDIKDLKDVNEILDPNYNWYIEPLRVFVFSNYKTYPTYGTQLIDLNKTNTQFVKYSNVKKSFKELVKTMNYNEGDLMFGVENYTKPSSNFTTVLKKVFKVGNKSLSVNLLRHSFLTDFLDKPKTSNAMSRISFLMAHSVTQQLRYRKLN